MAAVCRDFNLDVAGAVVDNLDRSAGTGDRLDRVFADNRNIAVVIRNVVVVGILGDVSAALINSVDVAQLIEVGELITEIVDNG